MLQLIKVKVVFGLEILPRDKFELYVKDSNWELEIVEKGKTVILHFWQNQVSEDKDSDVKFFLVSLVHLAWSHV